MAMTEGELTSGIGPFYCRVCGAKGQTLETRYRWDEAGAPFTYRRRVCPECGQRWATEERPEFPGLQRAKGGKAMVQGGRYYLGFREPLDAPEDVLGAYRVYAMSGTGTWRELRLRKGIRYHSPDGFSWGYHGSGPAELARHLLAHATGRRALYERPDLYQEFKREVVGRLPRLWMLDGGTIRQWVADHDQRAGEHGDPFGDPEADPRPVPADIAR